MFVTFQNENPTHFYIVLLLLYGERKFFDKIITIFGLQFFFFFNVILATRLFRESTTISSFFTLDRMIDHKNKISQWYRNYDIYYPPWTPFHFENFLNSSTDQSKTNRGLYDAIFLQYIIRDTWVRGEQWANNVLVVNYQIWHI